jgi:succinate dehydrogenase / fumarate reductase, cytochrome b subunit
MNERPLSPHLKAYRLPLTGLLSISHRISGAFLSLGMLAWVAVLLAVAAGEENFRVAQAIIGSTAGLVGTWLWIYALLLHLCHGVRHLLWDLGGGFPRDRLRRYALLELFASLTLLAAIGLTSSLSA